MAEGIDLSSVGGGNGSKIPYILGIVALLAAVGAWIWGGPSDKDVQQAVSDGIKKQVSPALVRKADSTNAYTALAGKANSADLQVVKNQLAELTTKVDEARNEIFGYAEAFVADSVVDDSTGDVTYTYAAKYNAGLRDLIRGRGKVGKPDTVTAETPDGETVSTTVRIAGMPSGAELQQAVNYDLPRVMASVWSGGVSTEAALQFAQTYRRTVGLSTSRARSEAAFNQGFQRAKAQASAAP